MFQIISQRVTDLANRVGPTTEAPPCVFCGEASARVDRWPLCFRPSCSAAAKAHHERLETGGLPDCPETRLAALAWVLSRI